MKTQTNVFWIAGLILIATCGTLLWRQSRKVFANGGSTASARSSLPERVMGLEEPCWFQQGVEAIDRSPELSAAFKQRTEQETRGYRAELPIEEAVRNFNEEEKCIPFRKTLPPLSADELIAAIVAGPTYGREKVWQQQKSSLWDIVVGKKMPAGSLLVAESGGCVHDSPLGKGELCVKGQRIYLFLNLHQHPRQSNPLKPDQIVLIRENYLGLTAPNQP